MAGSRKWPFLLTFCTVLMVGGTKGEGGGHKIGKMGRHRLWMAPNLIFHAHHMQSMRTNIISFFDDGGRDLYTIGSFSIQVYILVTARASGILKAKQKLGRTFNSDKLGGIAFTKISKLTMCSA